MPIMQQQLTEPREYDTSLEVLDFADLGISFDKCMSISSDNTVEKLDSYECLSLSHGSSSFVRGCSSKPSSTDLFSSFESFNSLFNNSASFSISGLLPEQTLTSRPAKLFSTRHETSLVRSRDTAHSSESETPRDHLTSTETLGHVSVPEIFQRFTHIRSNKRFLPKADPLASIQIDASPPSKRHSPKTTRKESPKTRKEKTRRPLTKWTKEEDIRLEEGVKLHGVPNWKLISNHVKTRTNKMCAQRWNNILKPEIKAAKRGKWTKAEDEQLRRILSRFDCKNSHTWEKAAEGMGFTRSNKQCRERWTNFLDPSLRHGPWTAEEDARLLSLHSQFGNKWKKFSQTLVGRCGEGIRRRFKCLKQNRIK